MNSLPYPTLLTCISCAITGNTKAMEMVLENVEPMIKKRCNQFRIPGYEQEDLQQEARLQIMQKLEAFASATGSFYGFCVKVIKNKLTDLSRRAHRQPNTEVFDAEHEYLLPFSPAADGSIFVSESIKDIFGVAKDDIETSILWAEQHDVSLAELSSQVGMSRQQLSKIRMELYARIRKELEC